VKRTLRISVVLTLLSAFILPTSAGAVSTNPTPVCAGATCTVTFTYTGDFYTWTAPYTGTYSLEVWGSQGGSAGYNGTLLSAGGLGGYAKGNIALTASSSVAIYVGGQGAGLTGTATSASAAGGWNGGGAGYMGSSTSDNRGAGGGGGTDIRVGGSTLSNRVIVAGGGAGGAKYTGYGTNYPGVGGGTSGSDGATANYDSSYPYSGKGGTQSAGGVRGQNCGTGATNGALGQGGQSDVMDSMGGAGGGGGYWGGGGSGCGMAGGGGSGYVGGVTNSTLTSGANVMPNPSGGTMTGNTGNGVARITYPNGASLATFAPVAASVNTGTITFNIVFNDTVTGFTTADLQISGAGAGSCLQGALSGSGKTYSMYYYSCNEGVTTLKLSANSVTSASSQNGPSADAFTSANVDFTWPTISSVTAPTSSTYKSSDTPTFTMVFSESVTITGTPRLTLTVGSDTKYANFLSMTDSKTALFRYTVGNSLTEFDSDGIDVSPSIDLNGGSIADLATNNIANFGFTQPTLTGVRVMQRSSAPTITSITPGNAQLTVNFSPGNSNGSTVTNYKYSLNASAFTAISPVDTVTPLVITGLTNGTSYSVRILAVNGVGDGDSSTAVSATPSTVVVAGGSNISRAYGTTSSTTAFTASGGTSPYVFTLTGGASGISIDSSTGVVTASSTLSAGTYSPNVVATDSNGTPRVGSLGFSIVIAQETPTVTISLPNSSTSAALGGAVTITATVSKDGLLVFKVDGSTISGCSAVSSSAGTATCSWTPGALGGVVLTAVLTPTDSTNYRSATTVGLSITVVNGVSTISLSLTGGVVQAPKGQAINIIAAISQAGRVSFYADGKRIAGCYNLSASAGNKSCSWKPSIQKQVNLTATLNPTNNVYNNSASSLTVWVIRRSGTR